MRYSLCSLALALLTLASPAAGQARWKEIGLTSSGNHVSVDPRSVKRNANLVTAKVRVVFAPPVQTPQGTWGRTETMATFDCAKRSLAAKENVIFASATGSKVVQRTVNKLPGYGPALKGSLGDVALTYLCEGKK